LPVLGLTRTFAVSGSVLGVLGIWTLWRDKRELHGIAPILIATILAALLFAQLRAPDVPSGFRLLESIESSYQSSRIIEGETDGGRERRLQVNEGFDSFQSVWREEAGLLPLGYYFNLFVLPPWWSERKSDWRVLVLGLAGGTTWRVFAGTLPPNMSLRSTGVEIDAAVVGLGERWMNLPKEDRSRQVLGGWDARAALHQLTESFDEVILDAYANQMEIPAHLTTVEFFGEIRAHLDSGGWLCVNIGSFGLSDPVVEAIGGTVAQAFNQGVLVVHVPFSRNCVLFARKNSRPPDLLGGRQQFERSKVAALLSSIALPSMFQWYEPKQGAVLTDDYNPIEDLQRRSIREGPQRMLGRP
jgi:spermidine synthase